MLALALLPGVGPDDPRIPADPASYPWSAVLRLNVAGVSRCTAVAVAPHWVATAAHCLRNVRLGRDVPAGSIHLLFQYDAGMYARHDVPDAVLSAPGDDLALLHLATPAPATLPPASVPLPPGTALHLAGFGKDRAERLVVDPACHALASPDPARLRHTCAGTSGSSGGPVLVQTPQGWRLAGIQLAARPDAAGGVAVAAAVVARLLP